MTTPWHTQHFLSGTSIIDAEGKVVWPDRAWYEGVCLRANATAGLSDEALEKGAVTLMVKALLALEAEKTHEAECEDGDVCMAAVQLDAARYEAMHAALAALRAGAAQE